LVGSRPYKIKNRLSGVSTNSGDCLARVGYYQYRADRARRSLRGIDQQIGKAEKAVAGQIPVKRNRFVQLTGGTKSVNRHLEAKARALAGLKGYADVAVMPNIVLFGLVGTVFAMTMSA
jgi:hypothetical protein